MLIAVGEYALRWIENYEIDSKLRIFYAGNLPKTPTNQARKASSTAMPK